MIVPDINLLVYAYNAEAPLHEPARAWWESSLSSTTPVGLAWVVVMGFVRLMSNRRVLEEPLAPGVAFSVTREWVDRPNARLIAPGVDHFDVLAGLLDAAPSSNLVTDAHIAALAIEQRAVLHSNDSDFKRFAGLSWRNPLSH